MKELRTESRRVSRAWSVFAVLSVLLVWACTEEASKPLAEEGSVVKNVFVDVDGTVTERVVDPFSEAVPDDKAGCTHIQFCDAPGARRIVCDTNDSTTGACASSATRCFECCDDARTVCGTANPISFDPALPGGTCTCG